MWSRPLALVVLIAGVLLAPFAQSLQACEGRTPTARPTATVVIHRALVTTSSPRQLPDCSFWRYRRKAVLEEMDSWIVEEVDLGPASAPDQFIAIWPSLPLTILLAIPLSLRC